MSFVHNRNPPFVVTWCLVLSFFFPLSFADYSGLSGEHCRSSTQCRGNRTCRQLDLVSISSTPCSSLSKRCVCFEEKRCSASSECDSGEACNRYKTGAQRCMSCRQITILMENGSHGSIDGYASCAKMGVRMDQCREDNMCKSPNVCEDARSSARCNDSISKCVCYHRASECTGCSNCSPGESCFRRRSGKAYCYSNARYLPSGRRSLVGNVCTSTTPSTDPNSSDSSDSSDQDSDYPTVGDPVTVPPGTSSPSVQGTTATPVSAPSTVSGSPEGSQPSIQGTTTSVPSTEVATTVATTATSASETGASGPIASQSSSDGSDTPNCIAAHHLAHMSIRQLVFNSHQAASVLCDQNGSCATAGHIVSFKGRVMRMGKYCDLEHVTCGAKKMQVNSPRMGVGIRVGSNTHGLEFTALSARYETVTEEFVLKLLARIGF